MKTIKLSILFVAFLTIGYSQNLVPNPSFEDTLYCPSNVSQINSLEYWYRAAGSPDNFNICSPPPYVSVPENSPGYQMPATGSGYSGLIPYHSQAVNFREYLGVQLISPLVFNSTYYISFKAVRAINNLNINCSSNNLGVFFSNVFYDGINDTLKINNSPHVYSTQVLVDTLNWTSLNFTFIPDSSYSYMYIGNFFSNNLTTIQQVGAYCNSYYYIDDVYVSLDSLTSVKNENDQDDFFIFPNPVEDIITIQNLRHNSVQIDLYNYIGTLVRSYSASNDETIKLDISELSQGFYLINIHTDDNVNIVKKITKL